MTKRTIPALLSRTEAWTLLAIGLVLLYRFPQRLLAAQLWAEDGTVFLMGQREGGISSLWTPYSGYLHLVPRLIALFWGSLLDLPYIPFAYNLSAFLLTLLTALFVLRARIRLPYKPLAAFLLVFVPHPFEVYLTITSLQWIFAAALPLFLLQSPASTRLGRAVEMGTVFLVGLTGPFLLLFLPVLLYRGWREGWRNRSNIAFCLSGFVAIVIQLFYVIHAPPAPLPAPNFSPAHWLLINGAVLIGGMVLGKNLSHSLMGDNVAIYLRSMQGSFSGIAKLAILLGIGLAVLGIGMFLWQGFRRLTPDRRILVIVLLLGIGATFLATMRRLQGDTQPLGPFTGGSRYCFLPYVYFAWTGLVFLTVGGIFRTTARALLLLEAVSTLSVLGPPPPVRDWHWAKSVAGIKRGETVTVPIPPHDVDGMVWQVHLRPKTR